MELIFKFLNKETSPEENNLLLEWVEASPANAKIFAETKTLWTASQLYDKNEKIDLNQEFELLSQTISLHEPEHGRYRVFFRKAVQYAAVILVTFSFSYLLLKRSVEINTGKNTLAYNEVLTAKGQKTQIALIDGTKVWMNAESKLKYGSDYNHSDRIVYLEGEAFFEVAKNKEKPFIVKSQNISVKALGTSFNIKSYPKESSFETSLMTGSVSIENLNMKDSEARSSLLVPNQRYIFSQNTTPVIDFVESKSLQAYAAWKDNVLVIQSESLDDIARKLERWFDVKVHVLDKSASKNIYSGAFKNKESIRQVLEVMKQTTAIQFTINQNDVYIYKTKSKHGK